MKNLLRKLTLGTFLLALAAGSMSHVVEAYSVGGGGSQPVGIYSSPLPSLAPGASVQLQVNQKGQVVVSQATTIPVVLATTAPVSIATLPPLSAGTATIGTVLTVPVPSSSPIANYIANQTNTANAAVLAAGDSIGATTGVASISLNELYNPGTSQWNRQLTEPIGTDPGSAATGALTIQGSASGVKVPVSIATLPPLSAGTATIGTVLTMPVPSSSPASMYINNQAGNTTASVNNVGDGIGATSGLAVMALNEVYNRATSQFNRLLGDNIGTDPGSGAAGALTIQGSASGVNIPVGGKTAQVCVTPTVTASSAYTANYEVGGLMTFASSFLTPDSGVLQSLYLYTKDVQTAGFKFYPFITQPTNSTWTNNAAPAINAADIPYLMAPLVLAAPDSGLGTHTVYGLDGIGRYIHATTTTLYGVLTTTGTPTFGSTSDVTVCAVFGQD